MQLLFHPVVRIFLKSPFRQLLCFWQFYQSGFCQVSKEILKHNFSLINSNSNHVQVRLVLVFMML